MEALFRKALEKTQPFTDSKTLLKIPKLTPMVRLGNRTYLKWLLVCSLSNDLTATMNSENRRKPMADD